MAKEKNEAGLSMAPDPLPKIGDAVNYVQPHSKKIVKVKVAFVHPEHDGRLLTLEVPGEKKDKDGDKVVTLEKVNVSYRPKEKLAGNTWHLALLALLLSLAFSVRAGIPSYHTFSAAGNAANPATVILPADPNSQIRIVSVFYASDTNAGALQLSSGTTAYSLIASNLTTSSITNVITATNGLSAGAVLVLQHGGVDYTNSVVSFGNTGTNGLNNLTNTATTWGVYGTGSVGYPATNLNYVVTGSGGFGVSAFAGDEIYLMGSITSLPVGAATNAINGDDIFSGNYGRPVIATLTPSLATNRLNSISAHYDSASQP